ncbi:VanZ family protein [Metabacillus fastidiosus]|uniref:VanZ family protein n=1 Tax=Metabacillus fastidiosus TaxID=1458 RepID=UPI000825561C|nr:VanZ family protein [Metabacillus fastidiosus]MED4461748.1 VanZ family protein [Metabacillus fastidiosus]
MKKIINFLFYTILIGYLLILLDTVFFSRFGSNFRSLNLVPFDSIHRYINIDNSGRIKLVDMNIWANILMFIPLGIYIMFFTKKKLMLRNLGIVVLFSLFIEVSQYIFVLGISDIDDIILNTFGGFIGILIFQALLKILKGLNKTKTVITILSSIVGIPVILLSIILYIANN